MASTAQWRGYVQTGYYDLPSGQLAHPGVHPKDALAPPLTPLKPRRGRGSAQKPLFAHTAEPKQDVFGLEYLRKQEERGRDRERRPRKTSSTKKQDIFKFSLMLTSFLLAPKVITRWKSSNLLLRTISLSCISLCD